eukprot:2447467-Amphidinium_carterae.1
MASKLQTRTFWMAAWVALEVWECGKKGNLWFLSLGEATPGKLKEFLSVMRALCLTLVWVWATLE